jgi:hypothetical protein
MVRPPVRRYIWDMGTHPEREPRSRLTAQRDALALGRDGDPARGEGAQE